MGGILIVGCGKMGSAMLEGWIDRGTNPATVHVIEPSEGAAQSLQAQFGVNIYSDAARLPDGLEPSIVVFAVKPQVMDDVLPHYKSYASSGAVFLSIAAGKTLTFFENHLGKTAAIVRTMPNTPAAIRRGMTVAVANNNVTSAQKESSSRLLEAVGKVEWIEDEALMDGVVAVSGSGPAYVFLLAEAMAAAGVKAGLPEGLATRLARETVSGAGELLARSTEAPAILRKNVTSPGGTTAAALEVLMAEDGLQLVMDKALAAAARRSKELG